MQRQTEPRPIGVSALAIASVIAGALLIGLGVLGFQHVADLTAQISAAQSRDLDDAVLALAQPQLPSVFALKFWALVAISEGGINIVTGIGLWMQRDWARVIKLTYSWIALAGGIIGLLTRNGSPALAMSLSLALWSIRYLLNPDVSDTFLTSYDLRMRRQLRQQKPPQRP